MVHPCTGALSVASWPTLAHDAPWPASTPRLQFKALTRITVKPLVETLPCLGGVTVSLMEVRGGAQLPSPAAAGCAVQHE